MTALHAALELDDAAAIVARLEAVERQAEAGHEGFFGDGISDGLVLSEAVGGCCWWGVGGVVFAFVGRVCHCGRVALFERLGHGGQICEGLAGLESSVVK